MITGSYEVRWFFDRPIRKLDSVSWEPHNRTDWYAPLSHSRSSVKFRDEATPQLDVKFFLGEKAFNSASLSTLSIQRWSKLSNDIQDQDVNRFRQLVSTRWIEVAKERWLLTSREGIQTEWTKVRAKNRTVWSFCIEAPESLGPEAVVSSFGQFAASFDLVVRDWPIALSYPQWLVTLP